MTTLSAHPHADAWADRLWAGLATRRAWLLCAIVYVGLRVLVFVPGQNFYADGIMRAELAERWAEHPHFIPHAGEVYEVGPLHVYLAGLGTLLVGRPTGARLPSVLFSILLLWPLGQLARRVCPRRGPPLAFLALAPYCLHLQATAGAASEAIFATLFLLALERTLRLLSGGRLADAVLGGGAALLACATRYEGWLYAGLLFGWVLLHTAGARELARRTPLRLVMADAAEAAPVRPAVAGLYGLLLAAFPLFWLLQNARHLGDPLWTFARHTAYHREFAQRLIQEYGPYGRAVFSLRALLFWPYLLLLLLSPGVAVPGALGVAAALRRPLLRGALLLTAAPPVYLSLRSALRADFGLVSRFTVTFAVVLAAFVGLGWQELRQRRWGRGWLVPAGLLWIGTPLGLMLLTHGRSGLLAERLRPLSPLSDLPPAAASAAALLRARAPVAPVLIDSDGGFAGMAVAYYSDRPESALIRVGWDGWRERLAQAPPSCAVTFADGVLGRAQPGAAVSFGGVTLQQVAAFPSPAASAGLVARVYCR